MKLKAKLLASLALLSVSLPAVAIAPASWSQWISEENGGPWAFCGPTNQAISGVRCSGSYCDNVSVRCETLPYGITMQHFSVSETFSEEDNGIGTTSSEGWYRYDDSNSHVCKWAGSSGIMTGFRCQGRYCDNITLECATPMTHFAGVTEPAELTDCSWSAYYSEEDPWFAYGVGANRYISGVRCQGRYCDNKSYYVCSLLPAQNSCVDQCGGRARGGCYCDSVCQAYGDCCSDYVAACAP